MIEVELKFQVPAAARRAVQAAVERGASHRTRLRAIYFDTPDRRLAAAGLALRLRHEGSGWVQTAKAGGADAMQRLEHNVALPAPKAARSGAEPGVDPLRHVGTPVGDRLAAALAPGLGEAAAPPLIAHFRTDVLRRHRALRTAGGWVELAFDSGALIAGDKRLAICELEIELLRGQPGAVIAAARRWVERHGVWLDVRSKAQRGDRLARGMAGGPVVKATPVVLDRGMSADAARYAVIANCLLQIMPNASEVASRTADGTAAGGEGADHVHQLRVGLRRLRSALRFFDGWTSPLDPDWGEALTQLFRQLGVARDRDALSASVLPLLRKAGAPLFELPPAPPAPTPAEVLRAPGATLALLAVLAFQIEAQALRSAIVAAPLPRLETPPPLAQAAAIRLDRWHRRIVRAARHYDALEDAERHRLRKRVKRLRYAVEFVASLHRAKAVARYLADVAPLQENLGRYNDLCVGLETYRAAVGEDPRAWFAIGWLTARRDELLAESAKALDHFAASKPFWDAGKTGVKAKRRRRGRR
ncbi:MAG TPA: CHAD domain-containing protein [Burkholderiaceae bacterium]|nr:CHAD domain-containing protein [Burkholderiaceae bacterium]HRP27528.1 CHAD domain-containing protein [Burkholderiaceae bacterium]